ncbi:MAG: response regulator [Candidatus Rokubacteria bacterium]|nr:response regulator [Candidatus Rokubacteria bacterium]
MTVAPLVLIADDGEAGRYATSRILGRAGYRVIEVASGREALETIRRERPELVLLDVNLPDMSGLDVCRKIKEDPTLGGCLVVQISASFVRPSDAVRGLEAGADAYVTEPIDPNVLVATVNALLRMRRAEDRARIAGLQLEATFDAISEGICLLDTDGVVLTCNRALAELAERPAEEIVGRPWADVAGPWLGPEAAALPASLRGARLRTEIAVRGRWLEITVDGVAPDVGRGAGAVCTVADITPRKVGEAELEEIVVRERFARSEAEAANRTKDEFLAVLSHELRTPLTAILGWVRTLRLREPDPVALAHGLEVIERNTRMQAQLIEDLLDVSRIVAGKLVLERRPVALAAVVEAALDSARAAADAYGVTLGVVVEDGLLRVEADPARLQQVVGNLVSNGVKFTPAGGRVDVRLRREGPNAVVTVTDTGRGIPPEFLPYVFDRFRQAEGGITRAKGGLGLGLAIVRHLVELHGGTVAADSDGDNRGATFSVTLPALADDPGATAPRRTAEGPTRLDGTWVLVVEDDADTREIVAMVLSSAGAGVKTVSTIAAAEAALAAARWDVLVSDLGMPDGSGYELVQRLRRLPSGAKLPAVALSAHAMDSDARLSLDAGFDIHLPKPVDPEHLIRVVASLVRPRVVTRAG